MTTIFICIDWFYPAYKAGGPVQSIVNLVAQYQPAGIQFKIYCSATDLDGSVNGGVLFDEWVTYNHCTEVQYVSKAKLDISNMRKEIRKIQPDILFINGIYSWHFNFVPLIFCKAPRKIVSVRGMLHPGALGQKSFKKQLYLSCWRMLGLHRRYQFHAANEEEKKFIQQAFGERTSIFVASNFPRIFSLQVASNKIPGTLRLVSVALISAMKNYLPVLLALEHCTENIRYDIYGAVKDAVYWEACMEQVKRLPANIQVAYHGDVAPSKVEALLSNAEVFILPSKSENFGHAFYEAFSAGKPVITSKNTPWNNLKESTAGINVIVENTHELEYAIQFFGRMGAEEFSKWNKGAKAYAERSIDLNAIQNQYDRMFEDDSNQV